MPRSRGSGVGSAPAAAGAGRDAAAHVPAREPLGVGEGAYWSLFDHMQEGLAHCRMEFVDGRPVDWTYLSVNPAFDELTDLRGAVGRRVSDLIPGIAETNPDLFEIYGRVAAGGPPERFETFVPGLERWFEISVYCPADGEFVAVFDIINHRKRAEEALRASEARYAELVRRIPVGVFTIRRQPGGAATFDFVSPQMGSILGLEPESLLRDSSVLFGVIHPDEREDVLRWQEADVEAPETSHWEGRIVVRGETRWVRVGSEMTVTPEGEEVRHGIIEDVTETRRGQDALRRLAAAVEQTDESVVITDPDAAIVYVNPAFERVTGYTRDEVLGKNPRVLQSGYHGPGFYREMWATLTAGEAWRGELHNRRGDGSDFIEEATITPVHDPGGKLANYVAVKRDVTRERTLQAQMAQVQRMEEIGRVAGGIAHDFNNLLTAINGYAALLADGLPADDPHRADVQAIREAGERAASLTRQLLAFSRRQTLQPAVLDVDDVVAGLTSLLAPLVGEDVDLRVGHKATAARVFADRAQLERVLVNLVTNARDAMPEGGSITIETAVVTISPGDLRLRPPAEPGEYVRLSVTDTGVGMDAATADHVFEPFFTTKPAGKGTGLGLATVEGVIAQSGGFVTVESEPGRGSTFAVHLPHSFGEPADRGIPAPERAALGGTETILLVEDDAAVRTLAAGILRDLGYAVIEAVGPAEAIARADEPQGAFDALVTDVVMPGMNGRELAQRLAATHRTFPTLYISGYAPDSVFRDGVLSPGDELITKPFSRLELASRLRALLDARAYMAAPEP